MVQAHPGTVNFACHISQNKSKSTWKKLLWPFHYLDQLFRLSKANLLFDHNFLRGAISELMTCMKTFSKSQPKIQLPKRARNHESDCPMENPGIGPGTSRMRSGRSTILAKARIMPLDQQARLETQSLMPFVAKS